MSSNYDVMNLLRIAKYYYVDGLSQQEIAAKENIHRTQISRILKQAREEGYVQIRISAPDSDSSNELARKLKKRLNLDDVFVIPPLGKATANQQEKEEALCFFGARYLENVLPRYRSIGIGMGKTLYNISIEMSKQHVDHRMDVYSLAGHMGSDNPYLQTNLICDRFAQALNGQSHYHNYPIITTEKSISELDKEKLEAMKESFRSLDALVVSVGGPFNLDFPYFKEFYNQIKNFNIQKFFSQPHGNLVGNVFYIDGRKLMLPSPFIFTSMLLEDIQKTPNVICISIGTQKVKPIITAVRCKFIKSLVTDQDTAKEILQQLDEEKPAK